MRRSFMLSLPLVLLARGGASSTSVLADASGKIDDGDLPKGHATCGRRRKLIGAVLVVGAFWLGGCAADTFVGSDAAVDGGWRDAADGGGGCTCTSPDLYCVYSSSQGTTCMCAAVCPPSTTGQDLSVLACTSTADCSGASPVCCLWRVNNVNQSACLPHCDLTQNQVQLCDPSSGDAGCPATEPCSSNNIADWNLPQSFGTCGGVGVP